jgi:hypothetical protein
VSPDLVKDFTWKSSENNFTVPSTSSSMEDLAERGTIVGGLQEQNDGDYDG